MKIELSEGEWSSILFTLGYCAALEKQGELNTDIFEDFVSLSKKIGEHRLEEKEAERSE